MNLVVTTHTALKTLLRLVAEERKRIRYNIRVHTTLATQGQGWGRVTF